MNVLIKNKLFGTEIRSGDRNRKRVAIVEVFSIIIFFLSACGVIGFSGPVSALAQQASQNIADNAKLSPDALWKMKIASNEHELILFYIESKSYDKVEPELKKIFDLKLESKYVAKSILAISYKLYEAKQFDLAQRVLDSGMANISFSKKDYSDILKFKALLLKETGDIDNALEVYKKAKELDEKQ